MYRAESRQASLAPIITVTRSGFSFAAAAICSGNCAILAPVSAWFQLRVEAPDAPSSRTARLRTSLSVPVAQDTSGQSASTEQASKPRVMESPTAATEPGSRSQTGPGLADGCAAAPFVVPSRPESQPVRTALPSNETAARTAAAVRERRRAERSCIPWSPRLCPRQPLVAPVGRPGRPGG